MATYLIKKCAEFESKVEKLSLIENEDPILKEISDTKKYEDRVKIAEKHWKKLGTGSARTIFRISEDLILKIAHNKAGEAQNLTEAQPGMQKDCINPIIASDAKGKWTITYWTKNIKKKDFEDVVGFGFDEFMSCLFYGFNNESDRKKPKDFEKISQHPLFKCLGQLVVEFGLLLGDIDKESSWGLSKEGKVVLRDAGFSKEVYNKYYKDDSSSSSSPAKTSES